MGAGELFETLSERLRSSAGAKTVFGEPIYEEDKTIIPVVKVSYGFGGGIGACPVAGESGHEKEGTGGGGGIKVKPAGVVEITREDTRYISFGREKMLLAAVGIGFLAGLFLARSR